MQFSKATLLAVLAALVEAQSISSLVAQIPSCATSCLATAIGASGCGLSDYACQCTTGHNAILANGAGCITKACSNADVITTTNVTNQICSIATASGGASTAASTAATAASSASSVSSAVSSAASSAASSVSSMGSSMSGGMTSTAGSATGATSAAAGTTSAAKASSTAPATATTNAGSGLKVGAGMMGAAVIAAIAL